MQKIINNLFENEKFVFWLFITPSFLGVVVFILIPIITSFYLSFCKWDMLSDPTFIGLKNYVGLFTEEKFWFILKNTIVFGFSVAVFGVCIPVILAAVINSKIRGSELFKTLYFLPFVTPMVVVAIIWSWIFDPNIGVVNHLFKTNIQWLFDTHTAMFVIIFVSVWKLVGYNMILLLSGFSLIDDTVYDSAKIDGASKVKTFFNITIPLLSPSIFFTAIITFMASFQVFDLIFLMTEGGPEDSTNILVYWLYKNAFEYFNIGKASAIAYILFALIFVLTFAQWKIRKKWVFGEE